MARVNFNLSLYMVNFIKTLSFFLLINLKCYCQQEYNNLDSLFSRGLYLNKEHILIPWEITPSSIETMGSAFLAKETKYGVKIKWDSVDIFYGLKVNVSAVQIKKKIISKILIDFFHCDFNPSDVDSLVSFINISSKAQCTITKRKKYTNYHWVINNCGVVVSVHRTKWSFMHFARTL